MTDVLPVHYLDVLPIWGVFLLTVFLLFLFSEVGFYLGRRWQASARKAPETGTIMGAALGLLAFMLAFTFGMAGTRFDARKQAVLNEANAIGTTWLRSQILPPPHPSEIVPLLMRYVEVRLIGAKAETQEQLRDALVESTNIHQRLWVHAVALGKEHPRSVVLGLFIESLNEVIDLHESRITVARYRIPSSVWLTLYLIAFASTTIVGVNAGLSGTRSRSITLLLISTLSVVMVLIIDLDRPSQTLFGVSQRSLIDLLASMKSSIR